MTPDLLTAFGQFGPLGLMIGYLVWEKKGEREQRREVELARTASDTALATALSALTVTIQHLDRGMK